jgi:uncharacterized repeat protein (TIGR02543 family)
MISFNKNKCKAFAVINGNMTKLKKGYVFEDGEYKKIYSAGNVVTYWVDTDIEYKEDVDSDASCLSPTSFTLSKDGWTFVGWREDTTASGDVLTSKVMGDNPISLYAVFKQDITVTTIANGELTETTKKRYYNNGSYANPTFTVANPTKSGATFKGWSTSASSTTIANNDISNLILTENMTRYAVFKYDNLVIYNSSVSLDDTNGLARTATENNTTYVTIGDIIYASARGNGAGTEDKESKRGTAYTLKSAVSTNHSGISVVLATRAYNDYGDANASFQGTVIHEGGKDFWTIKYTERSESLSTTAPYMDAYASIASTATSWIAVAGICVQKLTLTGGKTVVG